MAVVWTGVLSVVGCSWPCSPGRKVCAVALLAARQCALIETMQPSHMGTNRGKEGGIGNA